MCNLCLYLYIFIHIHLVMLIDAESRRKRKMAEISQALNTTPVDVAALRRMAISEGGLLSDEIRRQVLAQTAQRVCRKQT